MKKVLSVVLVFIVVFILAGCSPKIEKIVLDHVSMKIIEGESAQIGFYVLPKEASLSGIKIETTNPSVASVDENGMVTARTRGQVSVVFSTKSGITATCNVEVLTKSAYGRLNAKEKAFVDVFLKHVNDFKNPRSVVVLGIRYVPSTTTEPFWLVEVRAENSFGGTRSDTYSLDKSRGFDEFIILQSWDKSYNLDLINEALAEKIR